MWSHTVTSSPSAVIEALNQQAKAAEQDFRATRMDRIAREAELQRARDIREREEAGMNEPSTPSADGNEEPGPSKKKSSAKTMSAEVAHKMSNATALRSIGVFNRKQYSWLNSPSVSSPLAGKKRKKDKAKADEDNEGDGRSSEPPEGLSSIPNTEVDVKPDVAETGDRPSKRSKPESKRKSKLVSSQVEAVPMPTRRPVVIGIAADGTEQTVSDERVVTLRDVVFALDREAGGMGTDQEIVLKARILGLGIPAKDRSKRAAR
jgi:hypothetical protein